MRIQGERVRIGERAADRRVLNTGHMMVGVVVVVGVMVVGMQVLVSVSVRVVTVGWRRAEKRVRIGHGRHRG